jgi:hypothetical protein
MPTGDALPDWRPGNGADRAAGATVTRAGITRAGMAPQNKIRSQSPIVIIAAVVILLTFCYAFGPDLSRYGLVRHRAANRARGRIAKLIQGYGWYGAV